MSEYGNYRNNSRTGFWFLSWIQGRKGIIMINLGLMAFIFIIGLLIAFIAGGIIAFSDWEDWEEE